MKSLENIKISIKITALLMLLGAVTMFVAWNGSRQLLLADAAYSELTNAKLPDNVLLARVTRNATMLVYLGYRAVALDPASAEAQETPDQEEEAFRSATDLLNTMAKQEPDIVPVIDGFRRQLADIHALTGKAVQLGLQGKDAEAYMSLARADKIGGDLISTSAKFNDGRIADTQKINAGLSTKASSTSTTMYVMAIGSVLASIALGLFVTKVGITGPLKGLQDQMGDIAAGDYARELQGTSRGDEVGAMARAVLVFRENGIAKKHADDVIARSAAEQKAVVHALQSHLSDLSEGDLTTRITADFPGDYAALKINFNDALTNLRDLIGSVSESAATIRTGSGEIAQASEDLARRTESNAASLEETAASVTQIDGRLRASAAAATRTVERADQAIATVGGGRAVADEAVQAMGRVSDSAKGIDSVIEGLDKIAFQTRVLAMNAAVEAGRAGDAGRGFAVVADLVSALAMRAEEEAKRARDQLTVTQTDIVTAVEAVTKVDGALANISGDVTQVHELLATMAADNQAQSAAITEISAAISTMDQSTQQNAAMVEETSAAARNLSAEVGNLAEQAGRFKVGVGNGGRPAATSRPDYATPAAYSSPVKPLPAAAIPAMVPADSDWTAF